MIADNILDLSALEGLQPEEKELALRILSEMANNSGMSELLEDLKYAEYSEVPVDIETFLTDDNYLGLAWKDATGKSKLYPFWLDRLKELFPSPAKSSSTCRERT